MTCQHNVPRILLQENCDNHMGISGELIIAADKSPVTVSAPEIVTDDQTWCFLMISSK